MKHIYLIRHGRQDARDCNVNVELSREGRAQAALVGERLSSWHFDKMYSSVLRTTPGKFGARAPMKRSQISVPEVKGIGFE